MYKKKKFLFPVLLIVLLIVARILLPYFLERYVNRTLEDIPGYTGHVLDIDVALYRGAYNIDGLVLQKENSSYPEPLLFFPESDISLEWSALLEGRIVSEIVLSNPQMTYIFEEQKKPNPDGETDLKDWSEALTDLVPIKINQLQVNDGRISFIQFSTSPDINLFLEDLELTATNLSNVRNTGSELPSTLSVAAISFGGGSVNLNGRMDLMQRIPDMDMEFALRNADVTALNEVMLQFAAIDFASGTFELYSEVAIADGYLEGYLKPMFINTEILGETDQGFFEKLWEGFVGMFKFLFKNHSTETLATKAPIKGNLNNIDTGLLTTIPNIFKNAWINAFSTSVDENINFRDALTKEKDD